MFANSILFVVAAVLLFMAAFGVHVIPGTVIETGWLGLACFVLGHGYYVVSEKKLV